MKPPIVPPERLADAWPEVEEWIAEAVRVGPGDENILDVLIGIARQNYLLWWEPNAFAAVVQIQAFPRQRVAVVVYAGGVNLERMGAVFEASKDWCREHGINAIRTYGRKGWARLLGLEHVGVVLQARL